MAKGILILFSAALVISSFSSCKRNQYKVNISGAKVEIKAERLEKELFTISPGSLIDSSSGLQKKYGSFIKYFSYVINAGEVSDTAWGTRLLQFCTDRQNNEVYSSVESVFPDTKEIDRELSAAFSHYRYYFPTKPVPAVYTCITGFNNSIITGDSVLGISLDRYLGSESKYYQQLGLYKYQVAKMTPANIPADCMYAWAASEWDQGALGYQRDNVITSMIHEGKLYYFVRCMLPECSDELTFGFSAEQVKFCARNEGKMWQYLIENNLLFNSEQLNKKKLTGEAPFTSFFSTESPGRAAAWIGFRIVESYMNKNRNITLEELMKDTDIQGILEKARYHPPAS